MAGPESGWGEREALLLSLMGEARYWLGEFEARGVGRCAARWTSPPTASACCAHASRYLADITLTIRAEPDAAEELFAEALRAARAVGEPEVLARTLLMAGWAPYWRNELDRARSMFEEALALARGDGRPDPWVEGRALVGLASVVSPVGDERGGARSGPRGVRGRPRQRSAVHGRRGARARRRFAAADDAPGRGHRARRRGDPHVPRARRPVGAGQRGGRSRHDLPSRRLPRGGRARSARGLPALPRAGGARARRRGRSPSSRACWWRAGIPAAPGRRWRIRRPGCRPRSPAPPRRSCSPRPRSRWPRASARWRWRRRSRGSRPIVGQDGAAGVPNAVAARVWWLAQLFGDEAVGGAGSPLRSRGTGWSATTGCRPCRSPRSLFAALPDPRLSTRRPPGTGRPARRLKIPGREAPRMAC